MLCGGSLVSQCSTECTGAANLPVQLLQILLLISLSLSLYLYSETQGLRFSASTAPRYVYFYFLFLFAFCFSYCIYLLVLLLLFLFIFSPFGSSHQFCIFHAQIVFTYLLIYIFTNLMSQSPNFCVNISHLPDTGESSLF